MISISYVIKYLFTQEIKSVPVKSQLTNMATGFQAFCAAEDGNADTGVNFLLDCVTEIAPKVMSCALTRCHPSSQKALG